METGIYYGMSWDDYRKIDAVNNSILSTLASKSPLHALAEKEHPKEPSEAFIQGSAWHTMILEPDKFNERYAVCPKCDKRTKDGKAIYEKYLLGLNGKIELSESDFELVQAMNDSFKSHKVCKYIEQGKAEVVIVWEDKKTGLLCKARIDYAREAQAFLFDLKSTISAAYDDFQKALYNYGYFQQCAFYSDGWKTLTGDDPCFVFIAVEKSYPFAVAAYEMHENVISAGRKAYRRALETYADCVKTGIWPGYKDVEMMDLPAWALSKEGVSKLEMQGVQL